MAVYVLGFDPSFPGAAPGTSYEGTLQQLNRTPWAPPLFTGSRNPCESGSSVPGDGQRSRSLERPKFMTLEASYKSSTPDQIRDLGATPSAS